VCDWSVWAIMKLICRNMKCGPEDSQQFRKFVVILRNFRMPSQRFEFCSEYGLSHLKKKNCKLNNKEIYNLFLCMFQ